MHNRSHFLISLISWKPHCEIHETSLTKLLFSLSLFFKFSRSHERRQETGGWPCNLSHNRTDVYVSFSIPSLFLSLLSPSPKLYINYALFRTRPTRLYFRSNRKTTPERERTMALIYFSNLTNLPLLPLPPRWVDDPSNSPFPPPPFPPAPSFSFLRAFAPTEGTNIKGRQSWIKSVFYDWRPRNADITTTPSFSFSVLELICCR